MSRDIICLHILLHRNFFLCSKICKQIMSLDQMRDPIVFISFYWIPYSRDNKRPFENKHGSREFWISIAYFRASTVLHSVLWFHNFDAICIHYERLLAFINLLRGICDQYFFLFRPQKMLSNDIKTKPIMTLQNVLAPLLFVCCFNPLLAQLDKKGNYQLLYPLKQL